MSMEHTWHDTENQITPTLIMYHIPLQATGEIFKQDYCKYLYKSGISYEHLHRIILHYIHTTTCSRALYYK
jgi:hypothetical protein